jgi:hemerythrin-like domain-containing protein
MQETAVELLSRDHGVLTRVLLVLQEATGALDARMDLPPELFREAVQILRKFLFGHHQKVEEQHVYPLFESSGKLGNLIPVLRQQHSACGSLLEIVAGLADGPSVKDLEKRRTLQVAVHELTRMYRAHAAREDTVLFPALFDILDAGRLKALNGAVNAAQRETLGEKGYGEVLQWVSQLESALGLSDLSAFTPNLDEFSE